MKGLEKSVYQKMKNQRLQLHFLEVCDTPAYYDIVITEKKKKTYFLRM